MYKALIINILKNKKCTILQLKVVALQRYENIGTSTTIDTQYFMFFFRLFDTPKQVSQKTQNHFDDTS